MKTLAAITLTFLAILPTTFCHAEHTLLFSESREQDIYRGNTVTGEAFFLSNIAAPAPRWMRIKETGRVAPSNFKFTVISVGNDTRILRLDLRSGECWIASRTTAWRKTLEP